MRISSTFSMNTNVFPVRIVAANTRLRTCGRSKIWKKSISANFSSLSHCFWSVHPRWYPLIDIAFHGLSVNSGGVSVRGFGVSGTTKELVVLAGFVADRAMHEVSMMIKLN